MHSTSKNVGLGKLSPDLKNLGSIFDGSRARFLVFAWYFESQVSFFFCQRELGGSLVFRFQGHNLSNWEKIKDHRRQCRTIAPSPGGGGTPLYKPCRYVPPLRVGYWSLFGLKTCIHFAHFGLESGMVFEGTTGAYERIYRSKSKWIRKK